MTRGEMRNLSVPICNFELHLFIVSAITRATFKKVSTKSRKIILLERRSFFFLTRFIFGDGNRVLENGFSVLAMNNG